MSEDQAWWDTTTRPPDHQPLPTATTDSDDRQRTTNSSTNSPTDSVNNGHQQRTAGGDHQRPPTAATHRTATSAEPGLVDMATWDGDLDEEELTWRDKLVDALCELRFVRDSPGSLRDQIEYAYSGAYSIRSDGPWRIANIWYARLIAVPGLTICYFLAWALFTRLSRMLTMVPVIAFLAWALNAMPATAWLIPDWADFTTWGPNPDPTLPPGQGE